MTCEACDRIEQIRAGKNPRFIAELSESFVVLSDEQFYRGWCILLLKDHHEHLAALPIDRQTNLWRDVAFVAQTLTRELMPVRINYECLGNQLHHIHWHIIPRYPDDADPTMPVWLRKDRRGNISEDEEKALILRLSRALRKTGT